MLLRRKVFQVGVVNEEIPQEIGETLSLLEKEEYLGVKGGYAKAVLNEILLKQGRIKSNRALKNRWNRGNEGLDLDLVLTFVGTRKKALPKLAERVETLTEKLKKTVQLKPENVEPVKGSLNDSATVQRLLESRDLTINEVVLVPSQEDRWTMYYTDKCWRDTIKSVGILAANGKGTVRYDKGRIIAGPYGISRLIKFLVEGKVDYIYLPLWWIQVNKEEAKKLGKEPLGAYGLILAYRYQNKLRLQLDLMTILKSLGLTDLLSFETWATEQKRFFKLQRNNQEFNFKRNRDFLEIQKHLIENEEQRKKSQSERKRIRESCKCSLEILECQQCPWYCKIEFCNKCQKAQVTPKKGQRPVSLMKLLCNRNFIEAKLYDPEGFFPRKL